MPNGISRFMFFEILFRMAKFAYSTSEGRTVNEIERLEEIQNINSANVVRVSQAFYSFVNEKVKPFHKENKIEYN